MAPHHDALQEPPRCGSAVRQVPGGITRVVRRWRRGAAGIVAMLPAVCCRRRQPPPSRATPPVACRGR
jgi:hypothetical protein